MWRPLLRAAAVSGAGLIAACGGGGGGGNAPASTISAVTVTCTPASIEPDQTSQCTATVTGTGSYSTAVTWSSTVGTMNASGLFSAPDAPAAAVVTATSTQDSSRSGSDSVAVSIPRATADLADEGSPSVHVLYVVPSDGTDHQYDTDGTLWTSLASWREWFSDQAAGLQLRLDTYNGRPDITFVRLDRTEVEMDSFGLFTRDQLEYELLAAGFDDPSKIYLVYYDGGGPGTTACGGGPYPPDLPGTVAALYLQGEPAGAPPCASNAFTTDPAAPGYFEFGALHEVIHALGFTPSCAPHVTAGSHVSDSNTDLMYAGPLAWAPSTLDFNRDDYFGAEVPGCIDLARSTFLDPLPTGAEWPPGWPYANLDPLDCADEATLASPASTTATTIEFVNGTGAAARVYWLNGSATRQLYATLDPYEGYIQGTYTAHTWVVTDLSGQCLAIYSADTAHGRAITK